MLKRTPSEIVDMIKWLGADTLRDWMGTKRSDLVNYLAFDDAKEWLKPGTTEEQWNESRRAASSGIDPLVEAKQYLDFAWNKANGCRGLSAGRSLEHYWAWLWLAGEDEFIKALKFEEYEYYGKELLTSICAYLNVDPVPLDDGNWVNSESDSGLDQDAVLTLRLTAVNVGLLYRG